MTRTTLMGHSEQIKNDESIRRAIEGYLGCLPQDVVGHMGGSEAESIRQPRDRGKRAAAGASAKRRPTVYGGVGAGPTTPGEGCEIFPREGSSPQKGRDPASRWRGHCAGS